MANTDLCSILKSEQITDVLRAPQKKIVRRVRRLNPLTNTRTMLHLNPYSAVLQRQAVLASRKHKLAKQQQLAEKRIVTLPKSHPVVRAAKLIKLRNEALKKQKELNVSKKSKQ